jgi:ethanolamine ammonia-lyase small subunit
MERMSAKKYRTKGKPRAAGRNAKRVTIDGINFDSKAEARRWVYLRDLEQKGEISNLKRQVPIVLCGRDGPILTPTGRKMTYRADFTYIKDGETVVEDVKGFANDVYPIKKAILAAQGVNIVEIPA